MNVVMMERKEENWGDDRLDDLNRKVDEGFRDMREEFRAVRTEIGANQRTTFQVGAAIWVTSMVGFLGVIATVLTKV